MIDDVFATIENRLDRAARRAGDQAAAYALERVRKHAPVRKIFRGTTYSAGKFGRVPRNRRVRAEDIERVGHANSLIPLFRTNVGGTRAFLSGDFRRVNPRTGRLREISTGYKPNTIGEGGPQAYGRSKKTSYGKQGSDTPRDLTLIVGGKLSDPSKVKPVSAENIRVAGGKALTGRGRYEVRSGRANFRDPAQGNVTRVGGRLRGELHVEGPVEKAGVLWWYVVSATKDPETGRLYPRDQEYGTRHHKAHPFMRPGLHESRSALRRIVRGEMRRTGFTAQ